MKKAQKKLSRVSFVGVSNLPPAKAQELAYALQRIVAAAAETHNACDDARMDVDARYTQLAALRNLGDTVAKVALLVDEEVMLCPSALHYDLKPLQQNISQHVANLQSNFTEYSEDHPERATLACTIFELLLQLVQDTIELLRVADRASMTKLAAYIAPLRAASQEVAHAATYDALSLVARNLHEASVMIARRFKRRAEVFDDAFVQQVEVATTSLQQSTVQLLSAKQNALLSPNEENDEEVQISLGDIEQSLDHLDQMALCSPEFAVFLDVEYFDDDLGISLAAFLEAVKKGDGNVLVKQAKQLVDAIQSLLDQGESVAASLPPSEKDKALQACNEATAAVVEMIKTSKIALTSSNSHISNQMHITTQKLRKAVSNIPIGDNNNMQKRVVKHRTTLADAAKGFVNEFASLLASPASPIVIRK